MSPAGRLPETLSLLALAALATAMAASMADVVRMYDPNWTDSIPRTVAVLRLQREIAANPPGLLRDLRVAGGAGLGVAALGLVLIVGMGARLLRGRRGRRPGSGAGLAGRIGVFALLFAVAAAAPAWARMPPDRFASVPQVTDPLYPGIAPGFSILRLGLGVAIAANLVALVLGALAARRSAR